MVDLTDITRLYDDAGHGPALLSHEVVVDRGRQQQRRDRSMFAVGFAIGQNNEAFALSDKGIDLTADFIEPPLQRSAAAGNWIQSRHPSGSQSWLITVCVDVKNLGEIVVRDHRERQPQLPAVGGVNLQHVAFRPNAGAQRGHDLLADGIQRRVGDLSEQLREVVEQHPRSVADGRDGSVGAH